MKLMLLTSDSSTIKKAEECGVDRIFYDLEILNKNERQKGRDTLISNNDINKVKDIKSQLNKCELLVRVNPLYEGSKEEIDAVIEQGADIVMMPMITDEYQIERFVKLVDGRSQVCPLLETAQTVARIDNILDVSGVDELYIGLNDMHISFGLKFMFELLSGGIIEYMSNKISAKSIPFGFGGLAKIGEGILPAEFILGEHTRLGSSSVILSRTFRNEVGQAKDFNFADEIEKIRTQETAIRSWREDDYIQNTMQIKHIVNNFCRNKLELLT